MHDLDVTRPQIGPMTAAAVDKVRHLESEALKMPQVTLPYDHVLHGGLYARTMMLPAGVLITSAAVKLATTLIVSGDALIYIGTDEPLSVTGYVILPAAAGRKTAVLARADTWLTMLVPTAAQTVAEAEAELTDEADMLASRRAPEGNHTRITGGDEK
jgi:hypothetical protein